ncbi:hypothetical protein [Candidatus Palauibacter sp.]|uniref:hypothetical protein n=1 Tax=Candidatus Palauibacter sp. TaxID=3101350 RepID=UPI003B52C5EC
MTPRRLAGFLPDPLFPRMSTADSEDRRPGEGGAAPDVRGLLGAPLEIAFERYGRAGADRVAGLDRWLRFEGPGWSLRLRARPGGDGGPARVRSWTAAFARGFDTMADAQRALGLPTPKRPAATAASGDLRRPLRDEAGRVHSLTAVLRAGRIRSVSGFDEPPDWEPDE